MPASQKIGSFRPLTFLHSNKPVSPAKPRPIDRTPGQKGIRMSGKVSFREFQNNIHSDAEVSPQQLGRGAVRLLKSSGISVNIVI